MKKQGWWWGVGWLGLVLLGAMPAGAQPEEEGPAPEAERRDLRAALERRERALAEAGQRLREMQAQLREQRLRRGPEPGGPGREGPVVRVFPATPALQGAGKALEPLGKLPEVRFLVLPEQVVVWGPPATVEAITRVLAALDPTLQPRSLTLKARVYWAAEALPPILNPPRQDPLLPQVRERTGYENVSLLSGTDLAGVEGEAFNVENEMGVKGDWGELHGVLRLTATPQLLGPQEVQMRTSLQVEWMLGPGGLRRLQYEGLLRTATGQAVLLVSDDPTSRSALVLALTPSVGE
jgi:hypothetical protein